MNQHAEVPLLAPEHDLALALRKLLLAIPLKGAALEGAVAEANEALRCAEIDAARNKADAIRYTLDTIARLMERAPSEHVVWQQAQYVQGRIDTLFEQEVIGHPEHTGLLFDLEEAKRKRLAEFMVARSAAASALRRVG